MLPFSLQLKNGLPVSEQIVYAVTKAVVSGLMAPGDTFPSVRVLSQELRVNPNTAHKAVAALTAAGLLEVKPGIGTVVGKTPPATPRQRAALLGGEVERLVVEAKRLGLDAEEITRAVQQHWNKLS